MHSMCTSAPHGLILQLRPAAEHSASQIVASYSWRTGKHTVFILPSVASGSHCESHSLHTCLVHGKCHRVSTVQWSPEQLMQHLLSHNLQRCQQADECCAPPASLVCSAAVALDGSGDNNNRCPTAEPHMTVNMLPHFDCRLQPAHDLVQKRYSALCHCSYRHSLCRCDVSCHVKFHPAGLGLAGGCMRRLRCSRRFQEVCH